MVRSISVAAALIVALAALGFPGGASADVLTGVGVVPNPFSPNGDGTYDETAVRYELSAYSYVEVTVVDSTMSEVIQLWADWADSGEYVHWWDGSASARAVSDGVYSIIVSAHPVGEDLEEESVSVTVDTQPIAIAEFSVVPNLFTPDGDGVADSTLVTLTAEDGAGAGSISVEIVDSDEALVRGLLAGATTESVAAWWNGRDDAGAGAADGMYWAVVRTLDPAGNTAEAALLIDLDADAPTVGVNYPDTVLTEFRVNASQTTLSGWAHDRSGISAIEIAIDGGDWIYDIAFSGEDTVTWEYAIDCTSCIPDTLDETHVIYYRAHDNVATADGEGHYNGDGVPAPHFDLIFDVAGPLHTDSVIDDDDSIYYPGQTVTIVTDWDDTGYDIDADFSAVDSEFDPEGVSVTDEGSGSYTVTYTISSQASTPVPSADIEITATDYFERFLTDASVSVSLLAGTGEPSGLALDRNGFNPINGEALEIDLGGYEGPVKVDVYTLTGALIRRIEVGDASSVIWNGRNEDGDYVASGVYFVSVETDEGDAVRKVAVVK